MMNKQMYNILMKKVQVFGNTNNIMREGKIREAGLTLIALVVTIIVILILAGITLSFLFGEYGILGRAQASYQVNRDEAVKEEIQVAYGASQVDSIVKGLEIDVVLQGELRKQDDSATAEINGNVIEVFYKGYETTIEITTGGMSELIDVSNVKTANITGSDEELELLIRYFSNSDSVSRNPWGGEYEFHDSEGLYGYDFELMNGVLYKYGEYYFGVEYLDDGNGDVAGYAMDPDAESSLALEFEKYLNNPNHYSQSLSCYVNIEGIDIDASKVEELYDGFMICYKGNYYGVENILDPSNVRVYRLYN